MIVVKDCTQCRESLQCGLDLTHFRAIIDNLELMMSRIRREVRTDIPRQAAGQRIRLIVRKR